MEYKPQEIEPKWQEFWEEEKIYRAKDFSKKPKYYVLIEFPYLSGEGLHVGHCRGYSAMDAVARKKRMEGYNVLFPIGWDGFGLPAENYAIKTGVHPVETTKKNIINFKKQLKGLGLSFDWSREINTTDPKYYKWTQWIFLQFFKNGLAYQAEIPINWCPSCKIGLANEEVVDGKCERCGAAAGKKTLKQWMLKITKYADRLIDDLKEVDYPEEVKAQQLNWIGRSNGIEVDFRVENSQETIKVFTTRLDTIFGVTAVVLAPEHELVDKLVTEKNKQKINKYIEEAKKKSDFEREKLEKEKTGVFIGSYCLNPANNEKVPIWVGDYVVAAYAGAAVMVVPAHDKRDYQFAKKYGLEVKEVVSGGDISKGAFVDYGHLVNSGKFNGLTSEEAIEKIGRWLEKEGLGRKTVQYKLRDWVFSRQHYWGEPIPIIHCQKCGAVPVPEKDLPVELPYVEKYQPTGTGESPLAAITNWVRVYCPECGGAGRRETDTMPNWAGSSWYFMRYIDPDNDKHLAARNKLKYWLPVNWYNGGFEHTTLHLLYSRFWHKFLFDIGVAPHKEPYIKRTSHGIVLAQDGRKMSKSFGNVLNPDDIVKQYGADTLRVYEMFMGPFDQAIVWNTQGVVGMKRFLEKVWNIKSKVFHTILSSRGENEDMASEGDAPERAPSSENQKLERLLHQTIKKIGSDIENLKLNTAISQLMILVNEMEKEKQLSIISYQILLKLLSPFAPHIAEELWQKLGSKKSIFQEKWPEYDLELLKEEKITLVIQVNGRVRDKIEVAPNISKESAEKLTLNREKVRKWIEGKPIKKIVFIKGRLINIVV